jgi:hypothetical protein
MIKQQLALSETPDEKTLSDDCHGILQQVVPNDHVFV